MRSPSVSVIMPCYNAERHLPEAVGSVLSQTHEMLEFIIINDGSSDSTGRYLQGLTDPRVVILNNENNVGLARSINRGIAVAKGKFIARQDADDVSMPERIAVQCEYLKAHPEVALLGTGADIIDEGGQVQKKLPVSTKEIDITWNLLFQNPFVHSSVMMRLETLKAVGCYSESPLHSRIEDFELWTRISERFRVANIPEFLVKLRLGRQSVSSVNREEQESQREKLSEANIRSLCRSFDVASPGPGVVELLQAVIVERDDRMVYLGTCALAETIAFLKVLITMFYMKSHYDKREIMEHYRRVSMRWTKRLFSLSYRGGGSRTVGCRMLLLVAGVRLLADMLRPFPPAMPDSTISRSS